MAAKRQIGDKDCDLPRPCVALPLKEFSVRRVDEPFKTVHAND